MKKAMVDEGLRMLLMIARERLEEAASIAHAADACAANGNTDRAVGIANEIDDPIDEADRLLGMAATLARLRGRNGAMRRGEP